MLSTAVKMGKKYSEIKHKRRCVKFKEITESRTFQCFVYFALACTTIVFVYNMIVEYQTKATFVNSSKDNTTKDDVPVATICFISESKMKYRRDFTIQTRQAKTFSNRTFYQPLAAWSTGGWNWDGSWDI